ncbi:hypothetical protein [Paracnuella aquatica]|uniref:hypothetical protein n=1 Tax=Paracnuella aquatica TaxID=2268757 RepID=UPI000DEEAFA3|nr:hypothetical protein [Paracnuella aquatica]RPD51432.1 hypothetical protein DRJ53_01755 [Paracnuella aquatica]
MNLEYKHLLPQEFAAGSRVWIYQSSRQLTLSEALAMEPMIEDFARNWQSHGAPVKAYANLFFGQFLVLMADESSVHVGGCSTDSSVRFVKGLEQQFGINFFDRTTLAFATGEKVQVLPMNQLGYAFENGFINSDTLYFNNLVATKKELEEDWIIPVKSSWLAKRFGVAAK